MIFNDETAYAVIKLNCQDIKEWSKNNDWFNTSFIDSVLYRIENGLHLTYKQKRAIENIYTKCLKKEAN